MTAGLRDDREADLKKVYVHMGLYSKNTARTCVTTFKGTSFGELTCARKNLYGRRMNEGDRVQCTARPRLERVGRREH